MRIFMVLQVAFGALIAHRMRSILTMLGVVIGVAAVIALVAAGASTQAQVVSQFESLGANLLTVSAGSSFGFSRGGLQTNVRQLTNADVESIRALGSAIALIAPEWSDNVTASYQGKTTSVSATGVTSEYAAVRNYNVAQGRFISHDDDTQGAMVAILGQTVIEDLFGSSYVSPIGQTIRINRQNYTVIGTLESEGQGGFGNADNTILLPLRTAQLRLGGAGNQVVQSISLQVKSAEQMDFAQAQVTAILRTLHGLKAGQEDDFMVQNSADLIDTISTATQTFTVLLGSIGAISLLVGGIGIMNIMLVSVTERTREIGLRKAVGAKRRDILVQFLMEAIVLSVMGGVIGLGIGVGGAQLIAPLLGLSHAVITSQSVMLALGVSLGIGVFFGLYPANRAARLNPIDALRWE